MFPARGEKKAQWHNGHRDDDKIDEIVAAGFMPAFQSATTEDAATIPNQRNCESMNP